MSALTPTVRSNKRSTSLKHVTKIEDEVIEHINRARTDPFSYSNFLENYVSEIEENVGLSRPDPRTLSQLKDTLTIYKRAARYLRRKGKSVPPVQKGTGLSQAARDLGCHIGAVGILAPLADSLDALQKGLPEQAAAYKFVTKYGQVTSDNVIYENFVYSINEPLYAVAKIFASKNYALQGVRETPLRPEVRTVGCAIGPHKTLGYCVVLVFMNIFFEFDTVKLDLPMKTRPVQAIFTPEKVEVNEFAFVFI